MYKNGKIYVIQNTENENLYIGSTTQSLAKRFSAHRLDADVFIGKLYNAMTEIGKDKFYIELLEDYPCERREQLAAREGQLIREYDTYKNGYNGLIAGRKRNEYKTEEKEKVQACQRKWRANNVDHLQEYEKQRYTREKEKFKDKYERRKEFLNEKHECDCGGRYTTINKNKHLTSQKHQNFLKDGSD